MSNNPKNHPMGSGKPADRACDSDLDADSTVVPKKTGDTSLDADSTVVPNKSPAAAPTSEVTASAAEAAAAAAVTGGSAPSTRERRLDSVPTVPIKDEMATAGQTAVTSDAVVPVGLAAGRKLGDKERFTLIRELGRGGMGVVWLAHDKNFSEDVALKLLPPEVAADAMALADMRHETKESRRLTHEHIIRIHDLFEKDGEPAFVSMEFVDGPNLRKKLGEQQPYRCFSWTYLQPLIFSLCDALDYAHRERVIHRDLKPANVMLDKDNRLKLADFGIAATMSDSLSRVSQHGQEAIEKDTSGTLLYMSPQQLRGARPKATDDIYSLGATMYELLTSKPPFFSGGQAAIMYQVEKEQPRSIKERLEEFGMRNEVPEYVSEVVLVCLAKEPEKRPQSAKEVKERLAARGQSPAEKMGVPEMGAGGTVKMGGIAPKGKVGDEVLDVDVASAERLHEGKPSPAGKLVGICAAILVVLAIAWHFASANKTATVVADSNSGGTKTDTSGKAVTTGGGESGGEKGTSTTDIKTAGGTTVTPISTTPVRNDAQVNPSSSGITTKANQLVILPDKLSDSARQQLDADLQKMGVDSPSLVEFSLSDNLRDAFVAGKEFTVLERTQLKGPVLDEIDLSAGKYGEAQLSKIGHLVTANYMLVPEIQSISLAKTSMELLNVPKPRVTLTGRIKVNFRVVDVKTSSVLSSGSTDLSATKSQQGEPQDKVQSARDIITELLNKATQAEVAKVNHDVLHIDAPAASPK